MECSCYAVPLVSEQRLVGVRVLVTRPRERSEELCFLLDDEGAEVIALPLLELLPPEDPRPLLSAAEALHRYEWVVFASPLAVDALLDAARQAGTFHLLRSKLIATVGPRTAARVRSAGLDVNLDAEGEGAHGLAHDLLPRLAPDAEVLVPAAEKGREELFDVLALSRAKVTRVTAYRSEAAHPTEEALREAFQPPPQIAVFGSPRTVLAYLDVTTPFGEAVKAVKLVAIGPTTAAAITEAGLTVAATAEKPTPEGLVEAVVAAVSR